MKKMFKLGFAALAISAMVPAFAQEEEEEGAIGWTPIAFGLASPVQLPWGLAKWDVFGLDFGVFYTDAPKMYGLDVALATTTRDNMIGLAASGLFNYASTNVYGVRATIGLNMCRGTVYGLELGGFGFHHDIWGGDIEFLGTMQDTITGFGIGLICNLTEVESYGFTMAGGVNIAKTAYGAQFAGIFNMAEELHGCQLGLVNYARECPWGFQIGLVNIILDNKIKVLPIVNGYF